eukprot:6122373-Prymnesium_polylepis.1
MLQQVSPRHACTGDARRGRVGLRLQGDHDARPDRAAHDQRPHPRKGARDHGQVPRQDGELDPRARRERRVRALRRLPAAAAAPRVPRDVPRPLRRRAARGRRRHRPRRLQPAALRWEQSRYAEQLRRAGVSEVPA